MDNLILSLNVVLPLFLTMSLGYILKKLNMFNEDTLKTMNNLTFRVFLPTLLFYNVYKTELNGVFNPKLMFFAAISVLITFLVLCVIIPFIEKDNRKRGVLIQAIYRSNFVIFGLPVTASLFGEENAGVASILISVIVPIFNVLAVFALEIFKGGNIELKKILKGIISNPLIIASMIGLFTLFLGIKLPEPIEKTVNDISKIATPLALIILGGSFKLSDFKGYIKQLCIGVLGRLVIVPSILIPISTFLGFRGVELTSLLVIFASPTAVSSFTMAQQMDADSDLASQIIVFTSALSVVTVFLWIFILKQFGLI